MRETPAKPEQWANEARSAMHFALRLLQEDKRRPLMEEHKSELFKYAPVLAAFNRGICDQFKVKNMTRFAFKRRQDDRECNGDGNSRANDEITFYTAYFDAHIAIDELEKSAIATIMEYLVTEH